MNGRVLPPIIVVAVAVLAACADHAHTPTSAVDAGSGGTGPTDGASGATGGAPADGAAPPGDTAGTGGAGTAGTGSGAGVAGTGGGAGVAGTGGGAGTAGGGGGAGTAGGGNVAGAGGRIDAGGGAGGTGTGGATTNAQGPCDIYRDAGQPCVAAYSTVRRLLSTYAGPLYQIRSGSSAQNTGSGGETHDIGQTPDGFADAAAVDAACAGTICTVSLLYDQSGKGSHLPVAKAGTPFGGPYAAMDDFESSATKESLTVGGHKVYSLYMEPRQGYRLPRRADGMPRAGQPQGIYMLADGTHAGIGCCWEFGNAPPNAQTFADPTTMFFGSGVGTVGGGDGPWFMADLGTGFWAGGSEATLTPPPFPNNPSLKVKFALGFLKTDSSEPAFILSKWALRMADVTTASAVTTAHQGGLPKKTYNDGGVILGVGVYNDNASWGTLYEGAIVAGYPADDTELAVLRNVRAVGYGR